MRAEIGGRSLELTHLDKVFWPDEGTTKGDVIEYYHKIAPQILPHLKDRPESLNRHPNGIRGENFFQKDAGDDVPEWMATRKIHSGSEKKDINFVLCQDLASLIFLANLGCIEINPWNSRVGRLDNPDYAVFDIDPRDIPFRAAVEAALVTREVLHDVGAKSYCKTSGAFGLHVFVPLGGKYNYDQAQLFTRLINMIVNSRLPETTSLERLPSKRKRAVYLDYLQNRRGQTMASAYSLRPRKGAPVSTPLKWDELKGGLDPLDFTMKTIHKRVARLGDLWKGVLGPGIDLEKCLDRVEKIRVKPIH